MPNDRFRAQIANYHQRQADQEERRRLERDAARMRGERADAAALLMKSDPKLSAMAATDTQGRFARDVYGEGSPNAGTYARRMQGALASDDPIARQYGANAAAIIAARGEAINTAAAAQMTGGYTFKEFMDQRKTQIGLQNSVDNISKLETLNNYYGTETVPSAASGAYGVLRAFGLNSIRETFEAGALQQAELEFFNSIIPEFNTWKKWGQERRQQALYQLKMHYMGKGDGLVQLNPALAKTGLRVNQYTVGEVMGIQAPPPNTEAPPEGLPRNGAPLPAVDDQAEQAFSLPGFGF